MIQDFVNKNPRAKNFVFSVVTSFSAYCKLLTFFQMEVLAIFVRPLSLKSGEILQEIKTEIPL